MKICSFFILLSICFFAGLNCQNNPVSVAPNDKTLQSRETNDAELIKAVINKNVEKIKQLLENGANPNSTYKASETSDPITALGLAVDEKNTEIASLLLKHGANVDRRYAGSDSLNFREAVYNQDLEMVKLLAAHNADMEKNSDSPPLIRDVKNPQILDFLMNQGFDINAPDIDGRTCLTESIFAKNLEMVKAVLKYKPNLNLKTKPLKVLDYKEMTALQIARAYGSKEIIQALKKAGAK